MKQAGTFYKTMSKVHASCFEIPTYHHPKHHADCSYVPQNTYIPPSRCVYPHPKHDTAASKHTTISLRRDQSFCAACLPASKQPNAPTCFRRDVFCKAYWRISSLVMPVAASSPKKLHFIDVHPISKAFQGMGSHQCIAMSNHMKPNCREGVHIFRHFLNQLHHLLSTVSNIGRCRQYETTCGQPDTIVRCSNPPIPPFFRDQP